LFNVTNGRERNGNSYIHLGKKEALCRSLQKIFVVGIIPQNLFPTEGAHECSHIHDDTLNV
jgi:hypothetical protein